jgi:hypothetical protein
MNGKIEGRKVVGRMDVVKGKGSCREFEKKKVRFLSIS